VAEENNPAALGTPGTASGTGDAAGGAGGGQASSSADTGAGMELFMLDSDGAPPTAVDHGPLSKQDRDLRAEAVSTKHLLRHKPFNKYCQACLKSKMHERRHMTGSDNRDPKRWGEIITADHLVSRGENWTGIRGFRNAVNIKDLWSKMIASVEIPFAFSSARSFAAGM
jgi:hypothetical protein